MKKTFLHVLLIAIVGLASYLNSFSVPFQFDDLRVVAENPIIRNIDNFTSLEGHAYNPRDDYNSRRYLGYLSLALNYKWGGLDVTGFHVMNLLIHVTNSVLVYFFVILTFQTPYFRRETSETKDQESKTDSQFTIHDSRGVDDSPFTIHASRVADASRITLHNLHAVDYSPFTIHYSQFIALFSALLFVSHPLQTQAVTYIVQRFTSLATLFYLLAMVMYVKGRLVLEKVRDDGREAMGANNGMAPGPIPLPITSRLWPMALFLFSIVSAVCAMKTKEISFTLPIMILLYEFAFFRSTLKRKLIFLAPVLLTLAVIPMSMLHTEKPLGELLSDLSDKSRLQTDIPRGDYLMTEMRVIVTYLRLIFLPVNQNLDYDYPVYSSFFSPPVFLSFLLLLALFGTAVYLLYRSRPEAIVSSKKLAVSSELTEAKGERTGNDSVSTTHYSLFTIHCSRLMGFGILWFFLALSVESSFIPIVDVIFEHRTYLPSIGAFIALTSAFLAAAIKTEQYWRQSGKAVIPLALIIVALLSAATYARNRVWQDGLGLWEDVVKKSPGSARAHNNLGFFYSARGMNREAIEQFLYALRLRPDYTDARINLGITYNAAGMYDQAIEDFLLVLSTAPDDADAHNNLGIAYVSKGMFDEGTAHYRIAVRLWPDYAEAYNNLGVACGSRGMFAEAKRYFEQAIGLKADYFEANYNLALLLEKMGDHEKALEQYNKAGDMKPADGLPRS